MPSRHVLFAALLGATLATAGHSNPHRERDLKARGGKALIPESCFDSQDALEKYFHYGYPWGNRHNGAALMLPSQATIVHNAYLQLKSDYTGPQKDRPELTYNSGTVWAKQNFTIHPGGGLDFQANFVAPVTLGTWPACWLDGANTWPPEIDLAEWKGYGRISFNTYNSTKEITGQDFDYPKPSTAWHTILVELRAEDDDSTLKIDFHINGEQYTTQYGGNMVGQPFYLICDYQMEGSSGKPGPRETTYFDIQSLSMTSYGGKDKSRDMH